VHQVEALDRRIVAMKADVRDFDAVKAAVDEGVTQLGQLDIVSANAGVVGTPTTTESLPEDEWRTMIDINLTGVWHTVKATIPHLKAGAVVARSLSPARWRAPAGTPTWLTTYRPNTESSA
jgi:NAD(P)-dependent dehydrogenase (short-subunit alcohol dehydrogenase family)